MAAEESLQPILFGYRRIMRRFLNKSTINYLFYIYILFLINFVVIKFFGNFGSVVDRIEGVLEQRKVFGSWNYSFSFLGTISITIDSFKQNPSLGLALKLFIANILCFVPLGFLLALKLEKNSMVRVALISLGIILGIEITQFITCLGIADVDDVILNMLGSGLGYVLFLMIEKTYPMKSKIKNNSKSNPNSF
ncbi:VanZ family protein [Paenibacillus silvae]|uniref:VanZ family protein n=1 Tax=Paenibacillus silvae TaxID=1325358 RepID=UPI002005082E|nr:VanZ family protein [Paenibacillus silvae]MCK6149641.1 VanZ family protein [Paenibacillus silvae]MCK6267939.1 VanZ family protein [Paenibacillus silvae]